MKEFNENIECDWEIEMENQMQKEYNEYAWGPNAGDRKLLDILNASITRLENYRKGEK